ncbi:hypothetical protein BpHYR1_024552 [Brachionus plicatilis]|uniref:Uncharacterized protein n=1 Tax=Brachionus plicatilis TaxID=10195 RepID=A0A3M7RDN5_BRAPC|nr:hypothetical protein BpHYR1_024552 [Brachionus plicatilis]
MNNKQNNRKIINQERAFYFKGYLALINADPKFEHKNFEKNDFLTYSEENDLEFFDVETMMFILIPKQENSFYTIQKKNIIKQLRKNSLSAEMTTKM